MSKRSKLVTNDAGPKATALAAQARHPAFPMLSQEMVTNAYMLRSQLLSKLIDPRRNYDAECGYPTIIDPMSYRNVYDRQGLGTRVVAAYPEESWALDPEVYEDDDPATKTEFEGVLGKLITKRNLWHHLHRADELSGIGHFGVMLLGFDDGGELNTPVRDGVGDLDYDQPPATELRLNYIRHFDHSLARITQLETDKKNPRYGQPVMYELTFADVRNGEIQSGSVAETVNSTSVHWSRVVHLADNRKSSETFGMPRMQCVFNQLLDVKKMLGGSAEMFWKGGFPGFAFESTPNLNDLGADVTLNAADLRQQMDAYQNGLQRYFALLGVQVKSLAPQTVPPTGHLDEQYKAIAIAIGMPMRILMGSEQAQLASGQDSMAWNRRLGRRRDKYIGPLVIRPFIDRLIWAGVLPPPADMEYKIDWPDLSSPTDTDKAQIAATRTTALATYVSGGVESLVPPLEYLTQFIGLTVDEAEKILQAAGEHQDQMQQDQEAQQQQAAQLAQKSGLVPQGAGPGPGGMQFGQKPPPPPALPPGKKKPAGATSSSQKIKTNARRMLLGGIEYRGRG